MTVTLGPDARAARRKTLLDRWTEYLTDHGIPDDRAAGYARDLRDLMDELGFRLPAAIEDASPPTARPSLGGHGRQEFDRIRDALALPHADDCTPEMRGQGQYAADCERCRRVAQVVAENRT